MPTPTDRNDPSKSGLDADEREAGERQQGGTPPAKEDGPLESIGKAITAPLRDDPDSDVDEKPDGPASPSPARRPTS